MKTGIMKHTWLITATLVFTATCFNSNAQIAASLAGTVIATNAYLPVDVKLTAAKVVNSSEITWKALTQRNVRRYELEKSTDGTNFSYVTAVAGKAKTYAVSDENLSASINYYRLKVVTADGNFRYSNIISVDNKPAAELVKVLPAQLDNKLYIWVPANTIISNASITDASGRTVVEHSAVNNVTNLADVSISNLKAGIYTICLTTNQSETYKMKFTKGR